MCTATTARSGWTSGDTTGPGGGDQARSPLQSCACPCPGQDGSGERYRSMCSAATQQDQADRSSLNPPTMATDGRWRSSSEMEPESREGATWLLAWKPQKSVHSGYYTAQRRLCPFGDVLCSPVPSSTP